ncbi:putative MobA-like protein [Frankia sp. BMG5.23]|nr:putative MobA-like protein [Frankia sp. BMG5.23]
MGRPKALVELGGVTLVERGVRLLTAGGCRPVVVVTGAAADEVGIVVRRLATRRVAGPAPAGWDAPEIGLEPTAGLIPEVRLVSAARWTEGVGASLRAGLAALVGTDTDAVVVTLVDQPSLGAAAVQRLISAAADPGSAHPAMTATYGGRPAHPVLLRRSVWPEVAALARGEAGARAWLRAHPGEVTGVPCDGTGSPADVNTPADLETPADLASGDTHTQPG